MKKLFLFFAFTAVFFSSCKIRHFENTKPQRQSIVILFENDVHCAIEGYAKIAGLRDAIADTSWALLVSCGDYLQGGTPGAISHGQYIIDIMNSMHYTTVALGNHEFDYNVPRLKELISDFNAPVVCCNFTDMQGNQQVTSYSIHSFGDRKVAFVGVLTPETELTAEPYAFRDSTGQHIYSLHQHEYTAMVQHAVDAARAVGANYVILLSHTGEETVGNQWTSNDIIASTYGIDVVLDAHTHNVVDTLIANNQGKLVPLANTGTQFANIGKLWISPDGRIDVSLIPTSEVSQVSPTVNAVVQQVHQHVQELTGQVVAHSDFPLLITDGNDKRLVRMQETNTGDLVADALRWLVNAEIGIANGGGIRADIQAGDITYNDIINMAPFDNYVMKIEATGEQILEVLRQCSASLPGEDGDFPQVSGLRYSINIANHSVSNVEVLQSDGSYAPLSPTTKYTLGATDYVILRGGFHDLLSNCTILQRTTTVYRDALKFYLSNALGGTLPKIYATPQNRIIINH